MKKSLCITAMSLSCLAAQELNLIQTPGGVELSWRREFPVSSGVASQIDSRVLVSPDLKNWVELSSSTAEESIGDGWSSLQVDGKSGARFVMLEESVSYQHRASLGAEPAEYGQQLLNAAASVPEMTVEEFGKEDPACLPQISWDPTTATFWTEFNTSPEDHNAGLPADDPERRLTDFRLDAEELALFQKNGFVVSERVAKLGVSDFGDGPFASTNPVDYYYKVWTDDLPVFISSDSILDAWHQTFVSMLEEMEELYFYPSFRKIVFGVSDLSALESEWNGSAVEGAEKVRQAIGDLNVYLGTAKQLVIGRGLASQTSNPDPSTIAHWVYLVSEHSSAEEKELYGDIERIEDMTLYKPRGHYTNSQVLSAYFQTLIWLSRAQFHMASESASPLQKEQQDRELRAAVLLALHVRDKGQMSLWEEAEGMVQLLVGQSDAMTVKEMVALLESLSLDSVADLTSDANLATIGQALLNSKYGIQEIDGGQAEILCDQLAWELPRALSLFGQRWTPDAWTFNKVVVPSVTDDEGGKLHRRMPSGLDAMYAVLGNDTAAPILADRMQDAGGVPFRDGIPYLDELLGVRSVMDAQQPEFWEEHVYGSWLYSLKALSTPLPVSAPETFRTSAWKRRIMNTQLASWTHLRHDTLLYAEQSFTPGLLCEFPDGYVDPYPELFQRISEMALSYKEAISNLEWEGAFNVEIRSDPWGGAPGLEAESLQYWVPGRGYVTTDVFPNGVDPSLVRNVDLEPRQSVICDHLANFSEVCLQLKAMAENQRSGVGHTVEMKTFIRSLVEDEGEVYGGDRQYSGWFPNLYYQSSLEADGATHRSAVWNPVVADVHTDNTDICTGDPGGVLHEGVGYTQFMLVAVQHPDGRSCVFGGPVMSHFEFITDRETRLTDDEWELKLRRNEHPGPADWKRAFLVPEARAE